MNLELENIVEWFQDHPEISICGFFLGIILAIWSLIVSIKSRKTKRLAYSLGGHNLIKDFSEKLNGLDIKFNGENVKNLSVTKIAVWNCGNLTLHKGDIVLADALRIEAHGEVSILDYQILQTNETSNQFALSTVETSSNQLKTLKIDYDYMDPNQGCVIQILHNGSIVTDVNISGKLKGVNKFKNYNSNRTISRLGEMLEITTNKRHNRMIVGGIFILFSLGFPLIISFSDYEKTVATERILSKYLVPLTVLPYLYIGLKLLVRRIPKGLSTFDEQL